MKDNRNERLNVVMYLGCLQWASAEPNVIARFESDTGTKIPPKARNGLDRMIDEASGMNRMVFDKFVDWFDANVWGKELAPDRAVWMKPEASA